MLSLTDKLEEELEYQGKMYHINLCFDNVLQFYKLMDDQDLDEWDKVTIAFKIFFDKEAVAYVLQNGDSKLLIQGVEQVSEYINQRAYGTNDGGSGAMPSRSFSYVQDAEAIYASFMQQYGIDLIEEQGSLHWDKFKALLHGLNDQTPFGEIVHVREMDASQIEDTAQRQSVEELQDYYALTDGVSAEEQEQNSSQVADDLFAAIAGISEKGG